MLKYADQFLFALDFYIITKKVCFLSDICFTMYRLYLEQVINYEEYWLHITYLIETKIIANIRYFPNNGTTSDVGGIISTTSRKNTYKLVRIEIDSVTLMKEKNISHICQVLFLRLVLKKYI